MLKVISKKTLQKNNRKTVFSEMCIFGFQHLFTYPKDLTSKSPELHPNLPSSHFSIWEKPKLSSKSCPAQTGTFLWKWGGLGGVSMPRKQQVLCCLNKKSVANYMYIQGLHLQKYIYSHLVYHRLIYNYLLFPSLFK